MATDIYDLIREYRSLKTDVLFPFDAQKIKDFPSKEQEIRNNGKRIQELRENLDDITIKQLQQCKRNLILSVEKALELTSNNKLGYPLARNQGLIIPNYVYGKVLGIVESAMNTAQGFSYPEFYFQRNGDFDSTSLRELLVDFRTKLDDAKLSSFFELEDLFEEFEARMMNLWKKENEEHPQQSW